MGCRDILGKEGRGRGSRRVIIEGYGREVRGQGKDNHREVPQMMQRPVK